MSVLTSFALSAVVVSSVMAGCSGDRRDCVEPFGWSSVSPLTDSLTLQLEYAFAGSASTDSLGRLVREFDSAVAAEAGDGVADGCLTGRAIFWNARLMLRLGRGDEASFMIEKAVAMTDSSRYPYEIRRYRWLAENRGDYTVDQWYDHLNDEIEFYRRHHCAYMLCGRYCDMSWMMLDAGYSDRAIEYISMADSVLSGINELSSTRAGVRINLADLLCTSGDSARAGEMLHQMRVLPEIAADDFTATLVDFNLWVAVKDSVALQRAWCSLQSDTVRCGLRGMVAAFMARRSLDRGDVAEAKRYIVDTRRYLPRVTQGDHKAFMLRTMAETARAEGDDRESVACFSRYAVMVDSLASERSRGEIVSAEVSRQIVMAQERAERERRMLVIRFSAGIAVILLAIVAVCVAVRRRMSRLRRRHLDEKVVRLRSQRAELAMSLRVAERETLLDRLDDRLTGLTQKEELSAGDIIAAQAGMRAAMAAEAESGNFAEVFARLSPDFTANLHRLYPKVARSQERLACFIALGLDTRHIARIMNIRPESVRQARWRLRSQMELPPDRDLDKALKELL